MCGVKPSLGPDSSVVDARLSEHQMPVEDPERFYCPFPGCKRSFAELWRLKVHYRAPPNVRGSGKERGHGLRLDRCPKCGDELKIGGHHVRCSAREATRQFAKKARRSAATAAAAVGSLQPHQQPHQQLQLAEAAAGGGAGHVQRNGTHHQALTDQPPGWQQRQRHVPEQFSLDDPLELHRLQQLLDRVDQQLGYFDPDARHIGTQLQQPAHPLPPEQCCSQEASGHYNLAAHELVHALDQTGDCCSSSCNFVTGESSSGSSGGASTQSCLAELQLCCATLLQQLVQQQQQQLAGQQLVAQQSPVAGLAVLPGNTHSSHAIPHAQEYTMPPVPSPTAYEHMALAHELLGQAQGGAGAAIAGHTLAQPPAPALTEPPAALALAAVLRVAAAALAAAAGAHHAPAHAGHVASDKERDEPCPSDAELLLLLNARRV